jgi:hypothetical protein
MLHPSVTGSSCTRPSRRPGTQYRDLQPTKAPTRVPIGRGTLVAVTQSHSGKFGAERPKVVVPLGGSLLALMLFGSLMGGLVGTVLARAVEFVLGLV